MNNLKQLLGNLRSSFWFLPSLVVVDGFATALALIEVDSALGDQWLARWPRVFGVGAEGARQMLSTLAGSMMTLMAVTFSMTLVALALASNQYTSRILRNFMRSVVTQGTLGFFAGIFTYSLIVLRSIRGGEAAFVPSVSVFFAFVLGLSGIAVLVFFIHHIASSIQASNIIASVTHQTNAAIDRVFPERLGHGPDEAEDEENGQVLPSLDERTWYEVPGEVSGYIQSVDIDALMDFARDRKTIVRMERGIGAFVVQDAALALLALTYPPDQEMIAALNGAYSISRHRTVEQDPAFGIRQIVDIALKALSPGVNDTSTAVMCVDYLTAILARLTCRRFPPSHRYAGEVLRVITSVATFEALLAEAFDQIRGSAEGNVAIIARMLGAIDTLGSLTVNPSHRRALDEQVQWIAELADRTIPAPQDRARIERRLAHVRHALGAAPGACAAVEEA
ncbi:MAG: DUF2254 domain-containing protein [Chromatiaceae bacterium]